MPSGSRDASGRVSLMRGEDPAVKAWIGMFRVYQKMQREFERVLDVAGLTAPQFDVLANLGMSEGITQQELAERLLVTKGNVCGLLDRMESAGLVQRRADAKDRRANRIYLTRLGRGALRKAFPAHLGLVQECMGSLSSAELRTLAGLLSRIESGGCFE
jgi:DNA-binding MarR family transcriptional regulator